MSLFDLQTCETRNWLDILAEQVLVELIKTKGAVCDEGTRLFQEFGVNLSPCDYLNDELYNLIKDGNTAAVTNLLLTTAGLPPHTPKLLRDKYENLTQEEKDDVDKWAKVAGIAAGATVQAKVAETVQGSIKPPSPEKIKAIITRLNAVNKVLNDTGAVVDRLSRSVEKAAITVNTIDAAITAIDILVPVADASLVSSAATPTGVAATFARLIQKLEQYANKYRADVRGPSNRYGEKGLVGIVCRVSKVVLFAQVTIGALQAFTRVLTSLLEALVQEELALDTITPTEINNTVLQAAQGYVLDSSNNLYRGYRIEIKTDPDSPAVAPRRYAVAIDRYGVVVLEGRPSFSSSTEILVNEIKYQIDRLVG